MRGSAHHSIGVWPAAPCGAAEIGLDHGRVAGDLARRAAGDLAALVEHHDAARQRHDDLHDVLDDHERDAAAMDVAHQLDRLLHLGRRQAGHRLVEQQHLGLGGQRAGDLQPLAAGRAEAIAPARRRAGSCRPARSTARALARPRARCDVRSNAPIMTLSSTDMPFEGERHLEGAGETELRARLRRQARDVGAVEETPCPRSTGRSPVRQLKKVDLPAPFGPDQAEDIALLDRHATRRRPP